MKVALTKSGSDRRRVTSPTDMKDDAKKLVQVHELFSAAPNAWTHLGARYYH